MWLLQPYVSWLGTDNQKNPRLIYGFVINSDEKCVIIIITTTTTTKRNVLYNRKYKFHVSNLNNWK